MSDKPAFRLPPDLVAAREAALKEIQFDVNDVRFVPADLPEDPSFNVCIACE
jgi:hypothetical protein